MNCEVIQNRLLALPDPRRVSAELRTHLDGCPACRAFAAGVLRLDALLADLPVPTADEVKAAFLDKVTAAGPVITRVPVVPSRESGTHLSAVLARAGLTWRHTAGLAAALMVAVGGYWVATADRPRPQPTVAYNRHDLLARETKWVAEVTRADGPKARLELWSGIADDLRAEARALHRVADEDEMKALTEWYRKAVERGVVAQAGQVPDHDRPAALKAAMDRLAASAAESTRLADDASPHSKRQLLQMAAIARDGRKALQSLADGKGG